MSLGDLRGLGHDQIMVARAMVTAARARQA
jgi:hypothetical protein